MNTITDIYKHHREEVFNKYFNKQHEGVDFMHCHLGLITEIAELLDPIKAKIAYGREIDLVNIKEEIGDILFFLHYFIGDYEALKDSEIKTTSLPKDEYLISYLAPTLVAHLFSICVPNDYKHDISWRLILYNLVSASNHLFEGGIKEVLDANKRKLDLRYGSKGFNKERANNRTLEKEYNELKNN